jgi:nucleoid-associated protein YgaU
MGNLEKLAVLFLLFSVITILAVTLGGDSKDAAESDPITVAMERMALGGVDASGDFAPTDSAAEDSLASSGEMPAEEAPDSGALRGWTAVGVAESDRSPGLRSSTPRAADLLLDASTVMPASLTKGAARVRGEEEESSVEKRILGNLRGLRPSASSDYMEYRVQEGDTWAGLAQRFYRNGRYTRNLRLANEGLDDLRVGHGILVPVFDHLAESGKRAPLRPVPIGATFDSDAKPLSKSTPRPDQARRSPPTQPEIYEVREGDNLSKISLMFFGTPSRWPEIYESNRGLLGSADWLELGTRLTIPVVDLSTSVTRGPAKESSELPRAKSSSKKEAPKVN